MKTVRIAFLLLLFAVPAFAEEAAEDHSETDIAGTMFHHILDGNSLELFPFLRPIELSWGITVDMLMLTLAAVLILALFLASFLRPAAKPRGLAILLESLVMFVRDDIVLPVMGKERGDRWVPFFTTLFLFLAAINLLGLIPAFKTATGNFTVTSALALMVMLLIFGVGFHSIGIGRFFRNFYPEGTPFAIGIFVAILEFAGLFIKTIVLSLRIFANMFAGHLAILSFLVLMFVLSPYFALISLPFAVFTYALEVLVALIQALVFTLLSCIFITLSSTSHGDDSTHVEQITEQSKEN